MTKMVAVNCTVPEDLRDEFDRTWPKAKFASRAEALRALMRSLINQHRED